MTQMNSLAEDARTGLPGDAGLWLFILADMTAFALFFLLFALGRAADPMLYEESRQALDPAFGVANTIILLTSSWMVVEAVKAARRGDRKWTRRFLVLSIAIAAGFAVTKVAEYTLKAQAGISMLTNDFFMYYFAFTGIHFLHYLIGFGALCMTLVKARSEVLDSRFTRWIESVGCYWHMVDLLWIMLFPLLYLQRLS